MRNKIEQGFTLKKLVSFIVRKNIPNWKDVHNQEVRSRYGSLSSWTSIVVNLILFLVKGILGIVTGSIALVADAFHSVSDVSTSIVILISFRLAKKPSDKSHPFGHGRAEAIATLVVAMLLMIVAVEIFKGSVTRLLKPHDFQATNLIIGIVLVTILIKELLAQFTKILGNMIDSSALHADAWHHRTDAISSILVLAAFIAQRLGIPFVDGVAGVLVAGMIGFAAWEIGRKGVDDLLGQHPSPKLIKEIKEAARQFDDVLGIHDIIVHQYGQTTVMSFHIVVSEALSLRQAHDLSDEVSTYIDKKFHTYSTVHIDPSDKRDKQQAEIEYFLGDFLKQIQKSDACLFNDLRILRSKETKNLFFGLSVDPTLADAQVQATIEEIKKAIHENFSYIDHIQIEIEPKYVL